MQMTTQTFARITLERKCFSAIYSCLIPFIFISFYVLVTGTATTEEGAHALMISENPVEIQICTATETLDEEHRHQHGQVVQETFVMDNLDMNESYFMQPAGIQYRQDLQGANMCVFADLTPSNVPQENLPQHLHSFPPEMQLIDPYYSGNQFVLPENLLYAPCLPPTGMQSQDFQFDYPNHYDAVAPDSLLMHASESGSFFIANEQTQISGFVSSNLQDWGFSHPLGEVLKSRRVINCCFVLHSGNVW